MIVEYKIIEGKWTGFTNRCVKFEEAVNKAISEGWQPIGGVIMEQGFLFFQAVVRYK